MFFLGIMLLIIGFGFIIGLALEEKREVRAGLAISAILVIFSSFLLIANDLTAPIIINCPDLTAHVW
jgi:hypothetical protein